MASGFPALLLSHTISSGLRRHGALRIIPNLFVASLARGTHGNCDTAQYSDDILFTLRVCQRGGHGDLILICVLFSFELSTQPAHIHTHLQQCVSRATATWTRSPPPGQRPTSVAPPLNIMYSMQIWCGLSTPWHAATRGRCAYKGFYTHLNS